MTVAARTLWLENARAGAQTRNKPAAPSVRWRYVLILLPLLPLFGESFHYVKALPPLWALSKLFPLLSLPLALVLFRGERPPVTRQLLISLLWLILVPSFTAIFAFQQDFFTGLTAQVKLLPLFYFFSLLGLLRWLNPSSREIEVGFLICAVVTFVLLVAFWVGAPQSWYSSSYTVGDNPIFTVDSRGDRIRMPMFFGVIGILYCFRRFLDRRGWTWLLLAAAGFAIVLQAVRLRAMVLALAGALALTAIREARPRMRLALLVVLPCLLALLFTVPYVSSVLATDPSSGFDVRWTTAAEAVEFLGTNPLHWILGVGTISPLDPAGLITYFNHFFFLADVTWLGILFEYGLIGALLILAIPVRGLWLSRDLRRTGEGVFLACLQDFLVYTLLISPFYSLTLAPGEVAVVLAVFVHHRERMASTHLLRTA